ncbi:MAG: hypothetical protein OEY25_05270 [Candidatus Aminicenantes bacterium]|nr:hypothetical protein [Candidatus Aminicenantes bacterium]MDH5466810.1 hypothetical protein [Candidatus Aminicenantes bacterium]MDH5706411.1 hypothetical protein [Candidatus Aminicenantes bacterium]
MQKEIDLFWIFNGELNLRRGTRGGIYEKYFLVTKRIKSFQDVQKIKLRQLKKVDLACGQR